jgi:hypothetical protein
MPSVVSIAWLRVEPTGSGALASFSPTQHRPPSSVGYPGYAAIQRLRRAFPIGVRRCRPGSRRSWYPQGPLRRRRQAVRPVGARGDLHAVHDQRTAERGPRLSSLVTPAASPASVSDWRTRLRSVCARSQPARHRLHRGTLRVVVVAVFADQPHRPGPGVLVVPDRHRAVVPSKEGAHKTRDRSSPANIAREKTAVS